MHTSQEEDGAPPRNYHPYLPKTKGHEILLPLQEDLYHPQIHIPGRKGTISGKNREYSRRSKDRFSPYNRKIQGESQLLEIPPAGK